MAATYYLGGRSFTSKSGRQCFVISLLSLSRENWQGVDKFVTEDVYELCSDLEAGSAVRVSVDLGGNVSNVELSTTYAPLSLGVKL